MLGCSLGGQALGSGMVKEGKLGTVGWGFGHPQWDTLEGDPKAWQRGSESVGIYSCHLTTTDLTSCTNYTDQDRYTVFPGCLEVHGPRPPDLH